MFLGDFQHHPAGLFISTKPRLEEVQVLNQFNDYFRLACQGEYADHLIFLPTDFLQFLC